MSEQKRDEDRETWETELWKTWGGLHTACSELVSLVETVGDMEDERGLPFWEPELANAMRWLHIYPKQVLKRKQRLPPLDVTEAEGE